MSLPTVEEMKDKNVTVIQVTDELKATAIKTAEDIVQLLRDKMPGPPEAYMVLKSVMEYFEKEYSFVSGYAVTKAEVKGADS